MSAKDLGVHPVHLGPGAGATVEPPFDGSPAWYAAYEARHGDEDDEGRLVSRFTFDRAWTSWEMHPHGSEVVLCLAGRMVLHQEATDGATATVPLVAGEYAINGPGVWHTADVDGEATALFITAGRDTRHRPR
ncbi:MAG TPA: hypothetical protein VLA56_07930 [Pseudomonadales bacterium]|nr:hypothetical protein [Pseudomonadales bacterium]